MASLPMRSRSGRLHRLHRAVFAVGHPNPPWEGRLLAAVKACGVRAVASHYSAGELWGFVDRIERMPDVTVPGRGTRRHHGIRVHRTSHLPLEDRSLVDRVPVTSASRTLLDLAAVLDARRLRRAVRRALGLGRVTVRQLGWTLEAHRRRRGAGALRAAVASAAPTRSDAESDVLDLVLEAGFERPDVNRPLIIDGRRVYPDLRWPGTRLVVEIDSDAWHTDPLARADDRERQAALEAHGETVLRVHWRDAVLRPRWTLARLTAAGAPPRHPR